MSLFRGVIFSSLTFSSAAHQPRIVAAWLVCLGASAHQRVSRSALGGVGGVVRRSSAAASARRLNVASASAA